jgi:hypothetical protein
VTTKLLADKHWLVRGLTLRTLTDQYGQKVNKVLERYAEADPDEWVKNMAHALLDRIKTTTTKPTNTK